MSCYKGSKERWQSYFETKGFKGSMGKRRLIVRSIERSLSDVPPDPYRGKKKCLSFSFLLDNPETIE